MAEPKVRTTSRRAAVDASASSVLSNSQSWSELHLALACASEDAKGRAFELLVHEYLKLDSKYDFRNVWSTHGEVPRPVLKKLNLFNRDVTGIDLVAERGNGKYWAVQCKYHQDEKWSLSRKEGTGLIAGLNRAHGEFELGLICTTANSRSANLAGEPDLEYLMGDVWRGLGTEFFGRLHVHLDGTTPPPPSLKNPHTHQEEALDEIVRYFTDHSRGKVVMPCATGKSLIGFWAAERLEAHRVLVAVPNLSLVRQLLKDWTEQSLAKGRRPSWIVVCSDDSVSDSVAARDLGVKVDTDPREVAAWLESSRGADLSVAFVTYQSGRVLAEAAKQANVRFDVGIFDEAHRTAGREGAPFAHLLSDDNVRVRKRVYMTATPRIYKGKDREDIISMDDPVLYGGEAFKMSFLEAIDRRIIPNLTIIAVTVSTKEVERLLRDKLFVRLQEEHADEVIRAEDLVSALALRKAMKKYGIHRTMGFYSSRKRCHRAAEIQQVIGQLLPEYGALAVFHVDGEMTSGERDSVLRAFESSSSALLTNVRVFVEGVNCPSMDAVIFADPRQSVIDIVQGVGRALRPFDGKEAGYAIIPTIIEDNDTPSDAAYEQVVRIASALGSANEVILAYFAAIAQGKPWTGRRVFEVLGDVEVGSIVDLNMVNQAIAVRTYERTVEWRSFVEARNFVRTLRLNSSTWRAYVASGHKPADIPSAPDQIYSEWKDWGDWLGTGRHYKEGWRPFEEARAFVSNLNLASQAQWFSYCKSGSKPSDIPGQPNKVYKEWSDWGDWLGTGRIADQNKIWRPFAEAREFIRGQGLKTVEDWYAYARSRKPADIPADVYSVYKGKGWRGIGDWLGSGSVGSQHRLFRPFDEARTFARSLRLPNHVAWIAYSSSGKRPTDIPGNPYKVYKGKGWADWGDWLGSGRVANRYRRFRPFDEARTFARDLGLPSHSAWMAYCSSGKRPSDIPTNPNTTYRDGRWKGWGDWLGNHDKSGNG